MPAGATDLMQAGGRGWGLGRVVVCGGMWWLGVGLRAYGVRWFAFIIGLGFSVEGIEVHDGTWWTPGWTPPPQPYKPAQWPNP